MILLSNDCKKIVRTDKCELIHIEELLNDFCVTAVSGNNEVVLASGLTEKEAVTVMNRIYEAEEYKLETYALDDIVGRILEARTDEG